ncbi:50S ribosomal protein L15 [Candidatus Uhrbacteria bacterium]|nr:50S ribosomal protein L15 [Candidatus Uhrbacteria bacterium]
MELHTLRSFTSAQKSRKRVGRGLGSSHGTYSTRGMKGQRARSGGSKGLKARGLKSFLLRVPKTGGFKSIHPKALVVNLDILETFYASGDTVTRENLFEKGIIREKKGARRGKNTPALSTRIKILSDGKLTKKLTITHCDVSEKAKAKIEAAGGTVEDRVKKSKQIKHKKKLLASSGQLPVKVTRT